MVLALAGAIAFSGKAIIVKLSYRYGVDAVTVIMYRMLFALPFFVAMAWWASRQPHALANPLSRRDLLAITWPVSWISSACKPSRPVLSD